MHLQNYSWPMICRSVFVFKNSTLLVQRFCALAYAGIWKKPLNRSALLFRGRSQRLFQFRSRPETDATLLEPTGDKSPKRDSSCKGCAWPTPDANKTDYCEAGQ